MEQLRNLLVNFIRQNPLAPLAAETILVQSNGMKHWLTLSLAKDDALGICAATHMVLPSSQLWQIYRCVLGKDRLPMAMPLDKSPLAWRILRRLPHWLRDPQFAPLAHYLGEDTGGIRAYHLAQQLADVLDGYQNYRSDWLTQWAQQHNTLDRGQPLPSSQAWQAAMWRDLLADVEQTNAPGMGFEARSEVHQVFLHTLQQRAPGSIAGLPERLVVFGITALPMQTMQALIALGRHLPVLMFVHNPCREHWGHLSEDLSTGGHPLLASWGKQGRDYLHAIEQFETVSETAPTYNSQSLFFDPLDDALELQQKPSVLQTLQSHILKLTLPEPVTCLPSELDESMVFVQAHSAQREVEVLHDRVLAWLNADEQLQPKDIMVMVPDVALFAPHIHAVFGRYAGQDAAGLDLPYSVTDSTPRTHPLVQAVDTLLQLPQLRLSLREWLGLFQVKAVRERYGVSQADMAQLLDWLTTACVRWGLDAEHRLTWGIPVDLVDADQNTWQFGLRRLLLGYALGSQTAQGIWQNTASQPGIDGLDAPLVSGLLQWLQDMNHCLHEFQSGRTPAQWLPLLQQTLFRFFKATDDADQRVLDQVMSPLQDWLAECQLASFDEPVGLGVLRSHWMAQLDSIGLQRRFAAGGVQFATLMPMRAIPFKVVCLLGMNDNAYPRSPTPRDFDLISQPGHHRPGDRARREDDRYLFLEALLSARERMYISWQGRRASDHAPLPASVLVAQLMDHLNQCYVHPDPDQKVFNAQLQPLQPFSNAYFKADSGFSTYAADWAALRQPPSNPSRPEELHASPPPDKLTEQSLLTLLRQPLEVFFKHHLQVHLDSPQTDEDENEPFNLSGLNGYVLKQQVLYASQPEQQLVQLKLQGQLALAGGGEVQQSALQDLQKQILSRLQSYRQDSDTDLPAQQFQTQAHGTTLTLPWGGDPKRWRLHADGTALQIDMRSGDVKRKKNLRLDTLPVLWLGHLCANAAGTSTTSVLSGADDLVCLPPLKPTDALALLHDLMLLYQQAWVSPLPLPLKTACEFVLANNRPKKSDKPSSAIAEAKKVFHGSRFYTGECQTSAYVQRVFTRFEDMDLELFTSLAERVYGPMLYCCQTDAQQQEQETA
jgi:exodeoxyribonuclease V gamma subunit